MDTTDREITFDTHGVCNYCRSFEAHFPSFDISKPVYPESEMSAKLNEIKRVGKSQEGSPPRLIAAATLLLL